MLVNGFGAVCTIVVMMMFAITKFKDGAWLVLIIIPALVVIFSRIHAHYRAVAQHLSLERFDMPLRITRHRVIVPISSVHRGALVALRYARSLSEDVTAVHVAIDPGDGEKAQKKWETWGDGTRLVILDSPYRCFWSRCWPTSKRSMRSASPMRRLRWWCRNLCRATTSRMRCTCARRASCARRCCIAPAS